MGADEEKLLFLMVPLVTVGVPVYTMVTVKTCVWKRVLPSVFLLFFFSCAHIRRYTRFTNRSSSLEHGAIPVAPPSVQKRRPVIPNFETEAPVVYALLGWLELLHSKILA